MRYDMRPPMQIRREEGSQTTKSFFRLDEHHCYNASAEGEAPASSKTNWAKAKSKVRVVSESGLSESINFNQASPVKHFEGDPVEIVPEQRVKVPSMMLHDREEPLILLCDDVKEARMEKMHEQEDLIDLENSYFVKYIEIRETGMKMKSPDRSLMASKYASVPDSRDVSAKPPTKAIVIGKEEHNIESASTFEDVDSLTGPNKGLNYVPTLLPQNEKRHETSSYTKKKISFDPDTRWVTTAARLVKISHRSGRKELSAKVYS